MKCSSCRHFRQTCSQPPYGAVGTCSKNVRRGTIPAEILEFCSQGESWFPCEQKAEEKRAGK